MTPSEVLKALRLRHGLTQAELADQVGMDRSWVNQMETGNRPIGPKPRTKFAEFFNVSPLEFGGEPPEDPATYQSLEVLLGELAENQAQLLENQKKGTAALTAQLRAIRRTLESLAEAERNVPTRSRSAS